MGKSDLKFPAGFYWGTATSAHQVEGSNFNNWSIWEKSGKRIERLKKQGKNPQEYISGRACDHYHLYEQDFDLAKSLNNNAHRFSIEWSRIEPKKGQIDQKEIEHYRKVLVALKERQLEPFVTLYHWTLPNWLAQKGGWLNPKAPYYFDRFVKIVSENLFDYVNFWITINEPNVYASNCYLRGLWPPQRKNLFKYFRILKSLVRAHQLAYKSLRLIDLECRVGITKNNIYFSGFPLIGYFWNSYFLNKIKREQDFIGLNYYFQHCFPKKKNLPVSDVGWSIYPQGIYFVLKDLKKYQKAIYITENGLADAQDIKRAKFIKDHLAWIHQAIQEEMDVRGYFYWSLLDNFEWDKGFWPRFGLMEVDYKTMERKIRPSAFQYAKICQNNRLEFKK